MCSSLCCSGYPRVPARQSYVIFISILTRMPASWIMPSSRQPTRMRSIMTLQFGVMILGRTLLALLFLFAGAIKVLNPTFFVARMEGGGVPGFLLPAVIALELGAGLALLL